MGKILGLIKITWRRAINEGEGKNIRKLPHASASLWCGDLGYYKEASELLAKNGERNGENHPRN